MAAIDDIRFGAIRMHSADEASAFAAGVARDDRIAVLSRTYPDRPGRPGYVSPNAPAHGQVVEKFSRLDIYIRDLATCQICFEPVDLMAGGSGPAALWIDHIDPAGPHTLANCRLTHGFCNNDAQTAPHDDPELARARWQYKIATNAKAGPDERFPRRSLVTGRIVPSEVWRREAVLRRPGVPSRSARGSGSDCESSSAAAMPATTPHGPRKNR